MCNGVPLHRTSIYLTNGAQWNVDCWEPRNFLTKFEGGKNKDARGIMNLPDKIMEYGGGQPMKINKYSGYTLINYGRMIVDTPVAGELTIDSAEEGSISTLQYRQERAGRRPEPGRCRTGKTGKQAHLYGIRDGEKDIFWANWKLPKG